VTIDGFLLKLATFIVAFTLETAFIAWTRLFSWLPYPKDVP
jgi:hypothetical protein